MGCSGRQNAKRRDSVVVGVVAKGNSLQFFPHIVLKLCALSDYIATVIGEIEIGGLGGV